MHAAVRVLPTDRYAPPSAHGDAMTSAQRAMWLRVRRQAARPWVGLVFFAGALVAVTAAAWQSFGGVAAALAAVAFLLVFGDALLAVWVNRRVPQLSGPGALIGSRGVVYDTAAQAPNAWRGRIKIHGELWHALAHVSMASERGCTVRVVAVDGLFLTVTEDFE